MFSSNSTSSSWFHSLLTSWPAEFLRLLISAPSDHPNMSFGSGPRGDYANSVLHFGEREYVVLGFWKMGSGLGLAASMFIVALIAVLHEAVLGLRFFLEREQTLLSTATHKSSLSAAIEERRQAGSSTRGYVNEPADEEGKPVKQEVRNEVREIFRRTFTRSRMLQAGLYFVQWGLFLFAFVLVPCGTFNVPLIVAALLGKTAGYLLFIGSPAMESVERIPPSPSSTEAPDAGAIRLAATRKNLRSF